MYVMKKLKLMMMFFFCVTLISCGDDDPNPPGVPNALTVTGLSDDSTPQTSKTWNWGCENNVGACTYRHKITKEASYTFPDTQSFNNETSATKTLTSSSENGKWYIHVQTKDESDKISVTAKAFVQMEFVTTQRPTVIGLENNDEPQQSVTWEWDCINNSGSCQYRHFITKSKTHDFANTSYNSEKRAEKTLTSSDEDGLYYIHVQAKDTNGESSIRKVYAQLQFNTLKVTGLSDETNPQGTVTWTWGCENNSGPCKYRYAINQQASHTFPEGEAYTDTTTTTKTVASNSEDGTYYIHVQAMDSRNNNVSSVESGSALLQYPRLLTLTSPTPHTNTLQLYTDETPTLTVRHITNNYLVKLYNSSSCVSGTAVSDEFTITDGSAEITTYYLHPGTYQFYIGVRESSSDTTIDCKTDHSIKYTLYEPLAMGIYHSCYLSQSGFIGCWGRNDKGQLGQGDTKKIGDVSVASASSKPMGDLDAIDLGTDQMAKAIATGHNHTCAILQDDSVKCWGQNNLGQLGQGDKEDVGGKADDMSNLKAIDLGTDLKAKAITAGTAHTCTLLTNGRIKCWGYNGFGQLGQNDTLVRGDQDSEMGTHLSSIELGCRTNVDPCPESDRYLAKAISSGNAHTCAILENNQVKCWGFNNKGQLGQNNMTITNGSITLNIGDHPDRSVAKAPFIDLGTGLSAKAISAKRAFTCVLLNNDQVKCWGNNEYGQLGQNDTLNHGSRNDGGGTSAGQNGVCTGTGNDAKVANEVCTVAGLPVVDLGGSFTVQRISAGHESTCVVLNNDQGQMLGKKSLW